jgi:Zn-finger nucleic acid-binding protein
MIRRLDCEECAAKMEISVIDGDDIRYCPSCGSGNIILDENEDEKPMNEKEG